MVDMVKLVNKEFKVVVVNMFKDIKESMNIVRE